MSAPSAGDLPVAGGSAPPAVGDVLFTTTAELTRDRMVRYAGASRDFNPIHWNDRFAEEVGLPGVIAHGMLTMGIAAAALEEWAGDPGRIRSFGTRFSRPVPVPNPGTATLEVQGKVGAVQEDGTIRVDISVTFEGRGVLAKCQGLVAPAAVAQPAGEAPSSGEGAERTTDQR
ncbi:MAG TPA: acyl dehydratase [Actinomycetales bacterium]|nr:acyl dehydratase [Actinomycetales bacterium]